VDETLVPILDERRQRSKAGSSISGWNTECGLQHWNVHFYCVQYVYM